MRTALPLALAALTAATTALPSPGADERPAPVAEGAPPPGLACLSTWYAGRPNRRAGEWGWLAGDGTFLPWDDGRTKAGGARLDAPDVQDLYVPPYRAGAIEPVTVPDHDPGRVRPEALFAATYTSAGRVALSPVSFAGATMQVHRRAAPAFERVARRIDALLQKDASLRPFVTGIGGSFANRPIAGTSRTSAHAWGIAIDLNVSRSDYWRWRKKGTPIRWRNRIPASIVEAFEAEGFVWGGRWYHFDTMHFEWRPELFDPACADRAGNDQGR